MGTRHQIKVKLDDKIRVQQYGQWDGYPDGQGADIATFLHEEMKINKFKAALRECRFMSDTEIEAFNKEHSGKNWQRTHPWLSRDAGAQVLRYIQNDGARLLVENKDEEDSWCEYFYLIDMDAKKVSVTSRHDRHDHYSRPFEKWTVGAMKRLQAKDSD